MTRFIASWFAASLLVAATLPAEAQTVKLATLAPKGSPWHDVIRDIAEEWKVLSAGTIILRVYPGGVAGDDPDTVRKMRIGQLHAAGLTNAGLEKIAPEFQALWMPMMFRSQAELNHVRDALGPQLEAILQARGFKLLAWGDAGWVHYFTQRPAVHPDDFKNLKIFTWAGDTGIVEAYRGLGYQPVPLPATEIHTALQSGLITALPTTPLAALANQWFGLASHMTDVKWAPLLGAVVMSSKAWERLPEDLRPDLEAAARNAGRNLMVRVEALEAEAIRVMREHGLEVHPVPDDTAAVWEERARSIYPALIARGVPAALVAEVERLRDAYRARAAALSQD
jgi:TRAP-type C4-dicarboxylate transport system substrate-binding protein